MKSTHIAYSLMLFLAFPATPQTQVDLRTQSKSVDFSGANTTKPFRTGTQLPASCSVSETFFKTDATPGQNLWACTATNVWTLQSGASNIPAMGGQAGAVLSTDGTTAAWRTLGGDVGGTPDAAVVDGLQGRTVSSTAPSDGQVLRWNGTAGQWQPYANVASGGTNYSQSFTGQTTVTLAGSAHGLGTTSLLVDCYDTSIPAVRLTPTSVTVHPTTYDVRVTFAAPQSGYCAVNGSGASQSAFTTTNNTFASGTTQTFQAALVATSADRTAPVKSGTTLPVTCTSGDQFFKTNATAGQNLYFCTGTNTWTQMMGSQLVASVFGRNGAVTGAQGDYSFSQISGTASNSQLAAGIDAVKIGAGTVSNTVLGYLANATGDVQAQINGKAASSHSHTAAGDVSGDLSSLTVTGLEGRAVSAAVPSDGQALVWSAGASAWQPGTVAGGGGGAGMASQLGDFAVTRTGTTVLTAGANCSASTPCNARFGSLAYSITRSCTATITAGTGTAYIYLSSSGILTIGHNVTVSGSTGCLAQSGVTAFPSDALPLYTWTATSAAWDAAGGRDYRAVLSTKNVAPGTGIATLESSGRTTVSVDSAVVPTYLTGTATLDFASLANGSCAADQSFTLFGAATGDAVAPGWPAALEAGLIGTMRVSAANTISVRLCNYSGGTLDPASATFRATVVRNF
jgi:hypothetical protein